MKNSTIEKDLADQVMSCRVCGEQTEIPRKLMRDQHGLLEMEEALAFDHRECAADPDHPASARASRAFRKRIERAQQPPKPPIDRIRRRAA